MEFFLQAVLIFAGLVVAIFLTVLFGNWLINVISIARLIGDNFELLIREQIDKKFKQLRKEIDGD